MEKRIIFVTSNKNKVAEANDIGRDYGLVFEQNDLGYPEIRHDDIREIAVEGARHCFGRLNKPLIVEDSGLFIRSLNNFPGAYSSYVFKSIGNKGILKLMSGVDDRLAEMRSCVAFYNGVMLEYFFGAVKGRIAEKIAGREGFGYDPIFMPDGSTKTFSQDPDFKGRNSHRSIAVKQFCEWYKQLV